jgi:hypothetical protein
MPHQPVRIHSVTDEVRREQLARGITALEELTNELGQMLDTHRSLLLLAQRADDEPAVLTDPGSRATWDAACVVLYKSYCEGGTCETSERLARLAETAGMALGAVSGSRLLVTGGIFCDIDEPPTFAAFREDVIDAIEEYRLAAGSPMPSEMFGGVV